MSRPAVRHDDVEYARPDGTPLLARVYRADDAGRTPLPALVDVHGGAWTYFDRTADVHFDEALAADGLVVVALDFRQGPTGRWPAAAADVVAGVRWVKANAAALGTRPDDVGIVGGSSGGHLALSAALRPTAPELATTPVAGAAGVGARVAYVLALWPVLDPLARYRYALGRRAEPPGTARDRFFEPERLIAAHEGFFGDETTMARASARRVVADGEAQRLPPLWLAHAELDENVTLDMTRAFVDTYRRAGGAVELALFPGVGHAFGHFPGEAADRCLAGMRDFIARRLGR